MRYLRARIKAEDEMFGARVYMTDALMAVAGNTANMFGGSSMTGRWIDTIEERRDTRSPAEIAEDVMKAAGLVFEATGNRQQETG